MKIEVNQTWCGPYDLPVPMAHRCRCWENPLTMGKLSTFTVRCGRQIQICCSCGGEDDVGPARDGCITRQQLEAVMGAKE